MHKRNNASKSLNYTFFLLLLEESVHFNSKTAVANDWYQCHIWCSWKTGTTSLNRFGRKYWGENVWGRDGMAHIAFPSVVVQTPLVHIANTGFLFWLQAQQGGTTWYFLLLVMVQRLRTTRHSLTVPEPPAAWIVAHPGRWQNYETRIVARKEIYWPKSSSRDPETLWALWHRSRLWPSISLWAAMPLRRFCEDFKDDPLIDVDAGE